MTTPPQHQSAAAVDPTMKEAFDMTMHHFRRATEFITHATAEEKQAEREADFIRLQEQVRSGVLQRDAPHSSVWRHKVSEWCYQVVDHVGESREVVYRAMNILDRYLANDEAASECRTDRDAYQSAAMTALLLASHGMRQSGKTPKFGAKDLVRAGRGNVTAEDIEATAKKMVTCVSLHSTPPSPAGVVQPLLALFGQSVGKGVLSSLLDCATFLSELAVCDSSFVAQRSSVVAVAAVMCAVDACPDVPRNAKARFYATVEAAVGFEVHSADVERAAVRLHSMCVEEDRRLAEEEAQLARQQRQQEEEAAAQRRASPDVVPCDEREVEPSTSRHVRTVSSESINVIPDDEPQPQPQKRRSSSASCYMPRAKRSRNLAAIIEE